MINMTIVFRASTPTKDLGVFEAKDSEEMFEIGRRITAEHDEDVSFETLDGQNLTLYRGDFVRLAQQMDRLPSDWTALPAESVLIVSASPGGFLNEPDGHGGWRRITTDIEWGTEFYYRALAERNGSAS